MVRLDRLTPRSWIGFGPSIVRGRRRYVSGRPRVLIAVAPYPLSSSLPYPPPVPSPPCVVLHRDISVHVLSRDVLTPTLTCIDIRCRFPAGVCEHPERTIELSERIMGGCVWKLSTHVHAPRSLSILEIFIGHRVLQ